MRSLQQGLTLIELMVAIAVLAILVGVGVPAFAGFVNNSRMTSFVNATVSTARLTRAEAVSRNRAVAFCPSADNLSCTAPSTASGYIVFIDGGVPKVRDAGDEILAAQPFPATSVRVAFSAGSAVRFTGTGRADASNTLVVCDVRGDTHARTLMIQPTGRLLNKGHSGAETCS